MTINTTMLAAIAWTLLPACALPWICPAPAEGATVSRSSMTVEMGEIGDAAHVSLIVGDTLHVVLRATVSTGYSWHVAANKSDLLAFGGVTNVPAESKTPGAPGRQRLTFTAAAAGVDHLVLEYSRPWEKNVKPARSLTLDVAIALEGTSQDAPLSVQPAGVLMGKYMAKLPCADCSGILQSLAIYSPGPHQFANAYYVEAMMYFGRPNVSVSAGKLSVIRGTPADPNATVYSLSLDSSERTQNYLLDGNALVPLDDKLNFVHSPYDAPLERLP